MKYLIGDIGNTQTKLCILNHKFKIIKKINFNTGKIGNKKYLKKILTSLVKQNVNKKSLFSSVVPSSFTIIKKNLKKYFDINVYELKKTNYSKIIKINVNKKQIGSDRIANSIGAHYIYKSNCIVLDFGTATTFDVIIRGKYIGGIIAPGVGLSLSMLSKKADQIPLFTLKKTSKIIGSNTISALRSGFYWGYIGLIKNILQLIKSETKKNYKIILTGGYSALFKKSIGSKTLIDQDITMKGLSRLIKLK
tara:strand:- start:457 stop:1206 length:750 start_codon:yes stop_codon:yes gene_type:complete